MYDWQAFKPIPGFFTTDAAPAAARLRSVDGTADTFFVLARNPADNRIWFTSTRLDLESWSPWREEVRSPQTKLAPSVISYFVEGYSTTPSGLFSAVVDLAEQVWWRVSGTTGAAFSTEWQQVPGGLATAGPVVCAGGNGAVYIFVIPHWGYQIWANWLSFDIASGQPVRWSGWTYDAMCPKILTPPAAVGFGPGGYLIYLDENGSVNYLHCGFFPGDQFHIIPDIDGQYYSSSLPYPVCASLGNAIGLRYKPQDPDQSWNFGYGRGAADNRMWEFFLGNSGAVALEVGFLTDASPASEGWQLYDNNGYIGSRSVLVVKGLDNQVWFGYADQFQV